MAAPWHGKYTFPFNIDLPSISNKSEKVCVVGVVGKSSLHPQGGKALLIDELLQRQVFQNKIFADGNVSSANDCQLECFYNESQHVIYVHLIGIFDAYNLSLLCKKFYTELTEKGYLHVFANMKFTHAKALLLLFSICHIILIVHPGSSFDVSYLHLFRTLDTIRQKLQPHISDIIREFSVSNDWIQAARPCSPRALFIFQSCLLDPRYDGVSDNSVRSKLKSQKLPPIKKLEHALEDQIYRILRKSRIITNISGNSLFAIPANQEFVYVMTSDNEQNTDLVGFFLNQLHEQCFGSEDKESNPNEKHKFHTSSSSTFSDNRYQTKGEHSLTSFVGQHVELALTKGFDDNVGRHPTAAYFELPNCKVWMEIANKLYAFLITDEKESHGFGILNTLRTLIDIDGKFSEGRCGKVLPIASAAYQENLPSHYTNDYHLSKLAQALHIFTLHARGPVFDRYAQQLKEECERFWKNGRQLCEVISLTGNHCINPLHRLLDAIEDEYNKHLPGTNHASQFKLMSACDCGRQQSTKDDPFDAKAGNYDFYRKMQEECCATLEKIDFPIFQPSIKDFKAARITLPPRSPLTTIKRETPTKLDRESISTPTMSLPLSLGQSECSEGILPQDESSSHLIPTQETSPTEEQAELVLEVTEVIQQARDKPLVRQPSTTEYLPGMLHTESPPGLLPKFPSWSLVCLGPSSLYSHNIDFSELTVKIFLGVEYECPRGHRFICSAPDKVLKATGTGLVKDNANKITSSDMPLYFPCPCRSGKANIAQLMRVHVVTPKAPVHVTLNPRVKPAPESCPIFCLGNSEPVPLSQSAYWILRLPFVYVGEQTAYSPPKDFLSPTYGRLLKDMYGIAEATDHYEGILRAVFAVNRPAIYESTMELVVVVFDAKKLIIRAADIPKPEILLQIKLQQILNNFLKENNRLKITPNGFVFISKVSSEDSGNYMCSVIFCHYKELYGIWSTKEIRAEHVLYTLENLLCGASMYSVYMEAFNNIGTGSPSDTITVTTEGSDMQVLINVIALSKHQIIREGSAFVTIQLEAWPKTGCPVKTFSAEYKSVSGKEWAVADSNIRPTQKKIVISDLSPAT
uniref:Nonsense-mediated mRNA decay factor SMG8 n=1 Tax=Strigamia maritima TaxID=126957 RepID=T1JDF4_STRMM